MTVIDSFLKDSSSRRLFNQEVLIAEITELICQVMECKDLSTKQLALLLGIKKKEIKRILSGEVDMTIRELADIFTAMDITLSMSLK